jgi:penicillin-binding protein 1A
MVISRILNFRLILILLTGGILTTVTFGLGVGLIVYPKLPSVASLIDVQFQVPLRVYTRDEKLIAEFGEKKRSPLRIDDAPKLLIDAVLAAEDDRFFEHPGVDYKGLLRAVFYLIKTGEKGQGGSTITMQVARNFFLSREKTYLRKLNEILLALKIEDQLSKNEILELYVNKIYLGNRSYGFAAAAIVYYGLDIQLLKAEQMAMIAGLPKAPSRYNPIVNPKRALVRRNYVLNRMHSLGSLDDEEFQIAINSVDRSRMHGPTVDVMAPYAAEMVRAEMVARYQSAAYTEGYRVYTSIDSKLQEAGNSALRKALREYDERHGYRGAEATVTLTTDSVEQDWLAHLAEQHESNKLMPALVIGVEEKTALVYQPQHGKLTLDWSALSWARPWRGDGRNPGAAPKQVSDILKVGDVIKIIAEGPQKWRLAQRPTVEGALVSLSPNDGRIIALVGGFDFSKSKFNRVVQAERQPGSNLKPFNYSAAIEKGFTAASLINDAPVVFEDAGLETSWRPENYSGRVFGPTRLREALVKSRNLVSIRLLRATGIPYTIDYLTGFGFKRDKLPRDLSLALGSAAITPMELVAAYAIFANGGYKVEPYFIDRIETAQGDVVYRSNPATVCPECKMNTQNKKARKQKISNSVRSVHL